MGIGKGDKVAILAANSVEYLETFMGGLRAGACVVPLSTMAAADALEKMLDDCDAKVLFLSDQYRGLVEPCDDRLTKLIPGRPPRLRFRARRVARLRAVARRPATCRSSSRSGSSTTSTSSIRRARRACRKASCTATPCATCWRCASGVRLRARHDLARLDATLFEHHAGRGAGDARRRRHDDPDAQIGVVKFLEIAEQREGDRRHVGAGAVPAHPGASGFRQYDLSILRGQALHQRAVSRPDQGRFRQALAGPAHRELRPDRRRRFVHARAHLLPDKFHTVG